jgi:membrane associated rhomboid family serine protease
MGGSYWLDPAADGFRLLVEPAALAGVREQLARYDRESAGWPPPPVVEPRPSHPVEFFTPLLWAVTVLAAFQGQLRSGGAWVEAGALDGPAVFARGEWWRPATALWLHADIGHLGSNLLSGVLVFAAVATTLGRRRGWLLLALASFTGNLVVAALNFAGPHRSLGASTAVFAGLGLLTGRAIRRAAACAGHRHRWRGVFVPLASGLVLLGLYGAGDWQVDVVAHAAGFGAGLAAGLAAAGTNER